MKPLAYYAHSQSTYGTEQERRDIDEIKAAGYEVYNPDNPVDGPMFIEHGMPWFNLLLAANNFSVVFFRALNFGPHAGRVSYGTGYEVKAAKAAGIPVFEMVDNVNWRHIGKESTGTIYASLGRDDLAKLY